MTTLVTAIKLYALAHINVQIAALTRFHDRYVHKMSEPPRLHMFSSRRQDITASIHSLDHDLQQSLADRQRFSAATEPKTSPRSLQVLFFSLVIESNFFVTSNKKT